MSYLPIRALSAFSLRNEDLFMVLKTYCDGSGKIDNPRSPMVTLAGFIANDSQWALVEDAWEKVLSTYPMCPRSSRGNPYFHSFEAFNFTERYRGWDSQQVGHLAGELIGVLANVGGRSLVGLSCTVVKEDYRRVKAGPIPYLRDLHGICVDHCVGPSFGHPEKDSGIQIFFDRNEPFEPMLKRPWEKEPKNEREWWCGSVLSISTIEDMRDSCAMQAADLLAWCANRYYTKGRNDEFGRYFFSLHMGNPQFHSFFNEAALLETYDQVSGRLKPGASAPVPSIEAATGARLFTRAGEDGEWKDVGASSISITYPRE